MGIGILSLYLFPTDKRQGGLFNSEHLRSKSEHLKCF